MPSGIYIRTEEHKKNLKKAAKSRWEKIPVEKRKLSKEIKKKISLARLGWKISKQQKVKMSLAALGKNNSNFGKRGNKSANWRGGVTPISKIIRESLEYKAWRKDVFERDNYTCQNCGDCNGQGKTIYLEAHHIKSFSKYPKLRFELSNGITLCEDCHHKNKFEVNI